MGNSWALRENVAEGKSPLPALCSSRVRDPMVHQRQSRTGLERDLSHRTDSLRFPSEGVEEVFGVWKVHQIICGVISYCEPLYHSEDFRSLAGGPSSTPSSSLSVRGIETSKVLLAATGGLAVRCA